MRFTYFVRIFSIDGTVISDDKKSTLNSANFNLGTSALILSKRLIKSGSSLKYCGRSSWTAAAAAAATFGTLKLCLNHNRYTPKMPSNNIKKAAAKQQQPKSMRSRKAQLLFT